MGKNREALAEPKRPFGELLRKLVRVPKAELLAEERKYEAAKRRRKQRTAKKKP